MGIQLFLLLFISMWGTATTAWSQVEVGNGGDLIKCRPGGNLEGYFFLDYVMTYDPGFHYHPGSNPARTIQYLISERDESLGNDLKEFLDQAYRQIWGSPDPSQRFVWQRSNNGVATLSDEDLAFLPERFPENCLSQDSMPDSRKLDLLQIIFHSVRGDQTNLYKIDPEHLAKVSDSPRQMSFLLIHEWLWQYSDRAYIVRDVNRFLQTEAVKDTDATTFRQALINLGLDPRKLPAPPPDQVDARIDGSGWLRVLRHNIWLPVCADDFDQVSAATACFALGQGAYGFSKVELDPNLPGTAGSLRCSGGENLLGQCSSTPQCTEIVRLACDPSTPAGPILRGNIRLSGIHHVVEMKANGVWGGVCDDSFDTNTLNQEVLCLQLGGKLVSFQGALSGPTDFYAADDFECNGTERSILNCPYSDSHNCSQGEYFAVICSASNFRESYTGKIAIDGSGLVRIFHQNTWRALCDDNMNDAVGVALCNQLGRSFGSWQSAAGPESVDFWNPQLGECLENPRSIYDCGYNPFGQGHSCNASEYVRLSCR